MYKLNFTLKQHTPLIHFQHEQAGATLRATEVKPKLDRFILLRIGNGNYEQGKQIALNNDWLIGNGDKPALDYKMRIESKIKKVEKIPKIYPCFFGNMGEENDEEDKDRKEFIFYDNTEVTIHSVYIDLCTQIEVHIKDFFILTNFGTRVSKGFGGFADAKMQQNIFEEALKKEYKDVYRIRWHTESQPNIQTEHKLLFRRVDEQYKILKSGLPAKTSKLKMYANDTQEKIEWEKPKLQAVIENITGKNLKIDRINNNYHYVRALLGLAENFEYTQMKVKIKVSDAREAKDLNRIERMSSPILFKVFENYIYMLPNHHVNTQLIEGSTFSFSYFKDKHEVNRVKHTLNVPKIQFSVSAFLREVTQGLEWRKL